MLGSAEPCGSCGKPIRFGITEAEGKRMPVNADPDVRGNIAIVHDDLGRLRLRVLGGAQLPWLSDVTPDRGPYVAHFTTCTHPDQWRSRSARGARGRPAGTPGTRDERRRCAACGLPMGRPGNDRDTRLVAGRLAAELDGVTVREKPWDYHPACEPAPGAMAAGAARARHGVHPPDDDQGTLL